MKIEDVKKLSVYDRLVYFIKEREKIRIKKEAGEEKPWTDDVIFQQYRFCNVRRMDDKVSQWLLKNWYEPNFDHRNMVVACVMARHFNQPHALAEVGFPQKWMPKVFGKKLRAMKASGKTIFNGAYMVRGIEASDKTEMVLDWVCQPLVDNPPKIDTSSIQKSVAALLPYWGLSEFMAGQVVADLRWALSGTWKDKYDWAAIGPGSRRGMNRLLERPLTAPMKQEEFNIYLNQLIDVLVKRLPIDVVSRLEAIDFQNCLCEMDKRERTLFEGRKPKQRYQGV